MIDKTEIQCFNKDNVCLCTPAGKPRGQFDAGPEAGRPIRRGRTALYRPLDGKIFADLMRFIFYRF